MLAGAPVASEDEDTRLARGRLGTLLRDRWHLDELLGVGGTAAVYAATHRNGKRVAIKMLHPNLAHDEELRQRFIDEGYIANHVDHPGVASILDDDVAEDGASFLVMDLLEGEALDVLLERRGPLDPLELLSLMDDLLDVLKAAHANGIVHLDVKPGNVFVTRERRVKLLDFGIAQQSHPSRRSHVTPSGSAIGTPAFMAPEQARGQSAEMDARTDLWAVGATMFVALSGRHVHEADTQNGEVLAAMTQSAPSLALVAPGLPKPLVDFVDRALAYAPEERWLGAWTMQAALREVHAMLIEQQAQPASARDPLISFDESRASTGSHAPVTISARGLAPSSGPDAKTLVARPSGHRGGRWLAIGSTFLVMSGAAWMHWQHKQMVAKAMAIGFAPPTPAKTASMSPAAAPALPREPESLSSVVNGAEADEARAPDRPEAKRPATINRSETPRGVRSRGKAPSTIGTRSADSEIPKPSLSQGTPNGTVAPESPAAPIDPLERRR